MAASLNGFSTYYYRQQYIFYFFHLLSQSIGEKDHYMTLLLSYETPFCDAAVAKSAVL